MTQPLHWSTHHSCDLSEHNLYVIRPNISSWVREGPWNSTYLSVKESQQITAVGEMDIIFHSDATTDKFPLPQ